MSDCKFFIWREDVFRAFTHGAREKVEAMQSSISDLQLDKMKLEDENKALKLQLAKSNFPWKTTLLVIVVLLLSACKCSLQ